MRFKYDRESGAMYARLREGKIEETLDLGGGCYLDVGPDGTVMGLECLSVEEFRLLMERGGGELTLPDRVEDFDSPLDLYPRPSEDERRSLRNAISELPSRQRELLRLHYEEGLTTIQTAERLGASVDTTRALLRAALKELETVLHGEDEGGGVEDKLSTLRTA